MKFCRKTTKQKFELGPTRMDATNHQRDRLGFMYAYGYNIYLSFVFRGTCWIEGRKELGPTTTCSTCLSLEAHLLSRVDLRVSCYWAYFPSNPISYLFSLSLPFLPPVFLLLDVLCF